MKKLLLLFAFISFSALGYAQLNAGLAFIYGSEIEQFGIAAKGQYNGIAENIDGSVGLHFFFPDKVSGFGGEVKSSLFTINLDGHYNVEAGESFDVFGLAGLNIASITVKVDSSNPFIGSGKESDTKIGLNIGGGASTAINEKLKGFGEIKYVISDFDQLVVAFGVLMAFGE